MADEPRPKFGEPRVDVKSMRSTVLCLLTPGRPTAILRLVVAIVVPAIKRMLWSWSLAHVSKKAAVVEPPLANRNAPAAIVFVRWITRLAASATHCFPNFIFRHVGSAMRPQSLAYFVALKATTRASAPISQGTARDEPFDSAVAATKPAFACILAIGNNRQTAEPLARKVNEVLHG
jgi:hypothetical protein